MTYLNPEPRGPINPTDADLVMESFRKLYPNRRVYVFENMMTYRGENNIELAKKIIEENELPLVVRVVKGILPVMEVRYVDGLAACKRIMQVA